MLTLHKVTRICLYTKKLLKKLKNTKNYHLMPNHFESHINLFSPYLKENPRGRDNACPSISCIFKRA